MQRLLCMGMALLSEALWDEMLNTLWNCTGIPAPVLRHGKNGSGMGRGGMSWGLMTGMVWNMLVLVLPLLHMVCVTLACHSVWL